MNYYTLYPVAESFWDYFADNVITPVHVGVEFNTDSLIIEIEEICSVSIGAMSFGQTSPIAEKFGYCVMDK